MTTKINYSIPIIGFIILAILFLSSCSKSRMEVDTDGITRQYDPPTYETDNTNFRNGQILYPDYAHSDTLIVINADSINWCMEYYDIASDGDINDVLHAYCIPINTELRQIWVDAQVDNGYDMSILNDEIMEYLYKNYNIED